MSGAKPVYLDSNILIDWVARDQSRQPTAVGGVIKAICDGELVAVMSQVTRLEILECKTDETMWKAWLNLQRLKNVQVVGTTLAVMDRAYTIRDFYQRERDAGRILKRTPSIPDCIHVATATLFGCERMYTFDAGEMDKKTLSPLEMTSPICDQWPLDITTADKSGLQGLNV
jgi:predicted nucleic acid-binding protein